MDEILQLREFIETQRYQDALLLIGEMEEMAKEDKINKLYNYCVILLIHLIKHTPNSIRHALGMRPSIIPSSTLLKQTSEKVLAPTTLRTMNGK